MPNTQLVFLWVSSIYVTLWSMLKLESERKNVKTKMEGNIHGIKLHMGKKGFVWSERPSWSHVFNFKICETEH